MMWWYGNPMGGWGALFMDRSTTSRSTPEQMLAERFARGEIDEQEYHQRLDTLGGKSRPGARS
jgi:putative membrane protein